MVPDPPWCTTAAGLRAGVPMLILWLWLDQPVWAEAVNESRVDAENARARPTSNALTASAQTG
ncbi:hypothetical protein MAHJHV55_51950 [Mycobacterium avium subsp. hominissuis]